MLVLPDVLEPGLRLVVVGAAVGECSFRRGHYYAGRGDAFWSLLADAGLTPHPLQSSQDAELPSYGVGLTDVVKEPRGFDVDSLSEKLQRFGPAWVAFNGKVPASAVARWNGQPRPSLGEQSWRLHSARVFVLPSSSGANQRRSYDGRPTRLAWWRELAERLH